MQAHDSDAPSLSGGPQRVSLRRVTDDGVASDLVGDLVSVTADEVVLLPAGRGPVRVPRSQIRAMRRVPPRVVRPTSRVDDLQRLIARGWPGTTVVRMGGWSLHLGDGYSRRANSCHPTGDPERELGQAIGQVAGFYQEHGLRPRFQLAAHDWGPEEPGTALDRELAGRGWQVSAPSTTMVLDLRQQHHDARPGLRWRDHPDDEWLGFEPGPSAREKLLASAPAHYATLLAGESPIGTGRLAITDDWAGLSCVFISPEQRGRGHGRALTIAMMARARELGARFCCLQVLDANVSARGLYTSLDFVEHHRYHYRELVD